MLYELWTISSFDSGDPVMPFLLEAKSESFSLIYEKFVTLSKTTPCVVVINKPRTKEKIYESPDGGKTVYERTFGNYENRTKVKGK